MEPKISVIVPVYNVENYLCQCVDSIINQTYKNLEIILIDDESTDNSGQICDDYVKNNDRIIVIHQKNTGVSGARNAGLDIATGNYIGFVDSDDWIVPEMYEVMLGLSLKHDLDIVECGINESEIEFAYNNPDMNVLLENSFDALTRIISTSNFAVWKRLHKTEIIKDSRFILNRNSAEDVCFVIENFPKTNNIGFYDFPFYNYRSNPTSITKSLYNLKRLDDCKTSTRLLETEVMNIISENNDVKEIENNQKLVVAMKSFLLKEFIYHYKMLNYYPNLDPHYIHRNGLKELIDTHYFKSKTHDSYLRLANLLSVTSFEVIINLNKFRHRVFRTNQFS